MATKFRCTLCGFPHGELEAIRDHLIETHDIEWDHADYIEESTYSDCDHSIMM